MKNPHIAMAVATAMGLTQYVNPIKTLKNNLKKPMNTLMRNMSPHQSIKKCQRRIAQGKARNCYVHGAQYHG